MRRGSKRFAIGWALVLCLGAGAEALAERREPASEQRRDPSLNPELQRRSKAGAPPGSCPERQRPVVQAGAGRRVVRIDIHDEIDMGLAPHVERIVEEVNAASDVALLLLHMNTPGGRVDSAERIKDALLRSKVPTATLIDSGAFSAGALIAYATDFIIVTPGASMGAATPILIGDGGEVKEASEKIVSALRSMFRATAQAKGRNATIAEAMVDPEVDVPGLKPIGKLVTMTKDELLKWCVADFAALDVDGAITAVGAGGLSVEHVQTNWAEDLARFFTSSGIASILMSIGMLGLLIELYTPGFGGGGILALLCFALYFGGHLFVNLAGGEELLLFLLGLVLVALEVMVPGHIIPGILGVIAILAALVLAMVGSDLGLEWDSGTFSDALWRSTLSLIGSGVLFALVLRFLPRSRVVGRLVLTESLGGTAFDGTEGGTRAPVVRLGDTGVAVTTVTGSGKASFADGIVDVVSDGSFLRRGDAVVVVEVRPGRIVVGRGGGPT